jgi:hypothetical protein
MSHAEPVFAGHAIELRRRGLAVVPIGRDRTPAVKGFSKWSRPPSERTVTKWAEQHPTHNIALIPGLSNIWVADADDADQVPVLEEMLGPTPLRVNTNRGKHLYYRKPTERLPSTLRAIGLNVDLKSGNSLVIAPPSIHESGRLYALDEGCDWSALRDLPQPNVEKLRRFIDQHKRQVPAVELRGMRDGSRKQWLNDLLCRHAASCDSFSELLDVARTANQHLADRHLSPLDDDVVIKRAQQVWNDARDGRFEQWVGREGVARSKGSEIDELARLSSRGAPDAFMLLIRLRLAHSARCRRGETFSITPKAMARDDSIPGWNWKRYMRARDLLLLAGFIEKVAAFKSTRDGRTPAQYRLSTFTGAGAVPVTLGP